jgi:hypothetical protein
LRSAAASVNNEIGMHLVLQRFGMAAADANTRQTGELGSSVQFLAGGRQRGWAESITH